MTNLYDAVLDRLSYKAVCIICGVVLGGVALALVFSVAYGFGNSSLGSQEFGGQEVVDAHITADGLLRAYSRIRITRCPDNIGSLPIHISQPGATLESVSFDGRKVPFGPDVKHPEQDRYAITPGLPEAALLDTTMEVVWSMPLDKLDSSGPNSFRFYCRSAIPVSSYFANIILDEGAPYTFGGKFEKSPSYTTFWTKHTGAYVDGQMGYCGFGLVKKRDG